MCQVRGKPNCTYDVHTTNLSSVRLILVNHSVHSPVIQSQTRFLFNQSHSKLVPKSAPFGIVVAVFFTGQMTFLSFTNSEKALKELTDHCMYV